MLKENSLFVILIACIALGSVHSQVPIQYPDSVKKEKQIEQPKLKEPDKSDVPVVISIPEIPKVLPKQASNNTVEKNTSAHATIAHTVPPEHSKIDETFEEKSSELGPGAVNRAIIVFVLISLVFFVLVGIKTCRRKNLDKSRIMVRKYGVRTNRSDIEMEPLPLSDEEDYDTLFDVTATRPNS